MLLLVGAPAQAFTDAKVTMNKQVGGIPTRFTFEGLTDPGAPVSALELTFPEGFDLSDARVEVITLEGLNRIPVEPKTHDRRPDRHDGLRPGGRS